MKRIAATCVVLLALAAAADEVLTNADVVKLVKAGLSAGTIEAKIASSATRFDTSTDALVALAREGVPDRVILKMVAAQPRPNGSPSRLVRRYEVAVHRDKHAKCEGAELRIDTKGVKSSRCRVLDFSLAWKEVESVCYDYGFRGVVVFRTVLRERRVSTNAPAEAKKIVETVRAVRPDLAMRERCD